MVFESRPVTSAPPFLLPRLAPLFHALGHPSHQCRVRSQHLAQFLSLGFAAQPVGKPFEPHPEVWLQNGVSINLRPDLESLQKDQYIVKLLAHYNS